ncbi:MAG: glycyl-radical enzyme activating protein, partial [Oscillospiraceae bacterium]|nr:glycyl-radical enzyme activating protein [Oscillospiraceae bacterium]
EQIAAWLDGSDIRPIFISLLPYHTYGNSKYAQLGLKPPPAFAPPNEDRLQEVKTFWEQRGYKVAIGGTVDL